MKFIKITLGIFISIGTVGSFVSLTKAAASYDGAELIGHVLAIIVMISLAFYLFKSSSDSSNNEIQNR